MRTGKKMYDLMDAVRTIRLNNAGISAYYLCLACGQYHVTRNGKGFKGEVMP